MNTEPQKPTVLEAQQTINDTNDRMCDIHEAYLEGRISRQSMEDEEQIASLIQQHAQSDRQEAVDRQTGRSLSLQKRFKRSVTKFLFG